MTGLHQEGGENADHERRLKALAEPDEVVGEHGENSRS
jgi:hypothetical protein